VRALAAGEHTGCTRDEREVVTCHGALRATGTVPGTLSVDDRAVCGRSEGRVVCLEASTRRTEDPTPFVELLRGPGAPCGRTAGGEVWCFARPDADEGDAELVPLPLPAPAAALGSDGERLLVRGTDGTLLAARPPGHGGGPPTVVARGVRALASDGWTLACWLGEDGLRCAGAGAGAPAPRASTATTLAVAAGTVCAAGPDGPWCAGVEGSLGDAPVDDLAVGAGFACVRRRSEVTCAGAAPPGLP
jgi:hypothetical protein